MISAKVIADSISKQGKRVTTLQLRYPRMVHADFMTHRVFSRNGRSSRAVPFNVLVKEEPYIPEFKYNQKGMAGGDYLSPSDKALVEELWKDAATYCQTTAQKLAAIGNSGVHKQWVNRMLEWFGYIDVLVTSTSWNNFFELRDEAGAQDEIQILAKEMKKALELSEPGLLSNDQWHMPYVDQEGEWTDVKYYYEDLYNEHPSEMTIQEIMLKMSVARCARLTIKPFNGDGSIHAELARFHNLMVSRPVHASPAEHICKPDTKFLGLWWKNKELHGNLDGFIQYRKTIPYEYIPG